MNEKIKLIKHYPYRTARPEQYLFSFPRKFVESLEIELCNLAGILQDNHTTFIFWYDDGGFSSFIFYHSNYNNLNPITVMFHDGLAIFGMGVIKE